MPSLCRHFIFSLLGVYSGVLALPSLHVEKASVGDRTLILTFDDSIKSPDLSKLLVEGYSIENVVFVEDMHRESSKFSLDYFDMTLPGNGKIIDFAESAGILVIDLPLANIPKVGHVFADTAFGGLLRKVVSIEGPPTVGMIGKLWVLNTEEADLPDAVLDCDLAFKTRLDLSQSLQDISQSEDVIGELEEGIPTSGKIAFSLRSAQVVFQPTITGRIQIRNGRVDLMQFLVTGNCEVKANVNASLTGVGNFDYEGELTGKRPMLIPLGSGLFIKVQNRPFIRIESKSKDEGFSARGAFRIQNSLKGEIGFKDGQWRPLAENKMIISDKSVQGFTGEGEIKISLKPRIDIQLAAVHGPSFSFEPFARFSSNRDSTDLDGFNNQLSLGSNIYMETRTNFIGPKTMRSFLLFNREQTVLSPPREGILAIKEVDSNRIALHGQTFPKADYYVVQQKLGLGAWETTLEKSILPKIRLNSLKPNSPYRFRVIGVNAMGSSPAFPPEGLAFTSPQLNRPPFMPVYSLPDSGSVFKDSSLTLVWKGGDPDAGAKVTYTLILDTRSPPLSIKADGILDTTLELGDLQSGLTYFWKVIASDGIEKTEGPINTFSVKSPTPIVKKDSLKDLYDREVVLVPKGTFQRQDGQMIRVGPFFLDKNEVTQAKFQKLLGRNPSYRFSDSLPVERVTWEEAVAYCQETGGRLPTEAEWEYAARAGNPENFYWGRGNPSDFAWYRENSDNHTQKVGLKKPNQWGLHDMAGNVFEWVQDWYGDYPADELENPRGPASGTAKVIRGASWYSEPSNLNLASRYSNRPGFRNFKVGFRCAKDVESAVLGVRSSAGAVLTSKATAPILKSGLGPTIP